MLGRARGVGVPLHVDLEHVGVCVDELRDLLADGPAHVTDARAVRVEVDDVIEEDLVANQADLIPGSRAPVRPGICRPDAGHVGARILVVEDGVVVTVQAGASVGPGVARPEAGDIGARVLVVEHAIAITVGAGGARSRCAER